MKNEGERQRKVEYFPKGWQILSAISSMVFHTVHWTSSSLERGVRQIWSKGKEHPFTTLKECGLWLSTDMSLKMDALNNNLDFESQFKRKASKYLALLG